MRNEKERQRGERRCAGVKSSVRSPMRASSAWLGRAPSRFDGKFGGVHGVPELGEPGGAEAGGRLLFGLLIGRAHADLFPGKDLPELACLALEHGEQIEKRFLALGLFLKDAFPDGSGLPRLKLAQEREYVEFGRRADAAGLFLRQRFSARQQLELAQFRVHGGSVRKERFGENVHAARFQIQPQRLGTYLDVAAERAGLQPGGTPDSTPWHRQR